MTDQQLVKAVKAAAQARVPPDRVEARVGKSAAVNTSRGEIDRARLRGATIYPDDAAQAQPVRFDGARDVVYWGRDVAAHNAPIVGLIYKADGSVEDFTAYVLPP